MDRTGSTLRLFPHTSRQLVYFGPAHYDSFSLLLHASITFIILNTGYAASLYYTRPPTASTGAFSLSKAIRTTWALLCSEYDSSHILVLYLLVSVWLVGFSLVSLILAWRYERDEIRFADDVILVQSEEAEAGELGGDGEGLKMITSGVDCSKVVLVTLPRSSSGPIGDGAVAEKEMTSGGEGSSTAKNSASIAIGVLKE